MADHPRTEDTEALITDLAGFAYDPLAAVMYGFPWGEPGPLLRFSGPRTWQREVLIALGKRVAENGFALDNGMVDLLDTYHEAITSGRGIGKSSLFAMISWWLLSCVIGSSVTVTANTKQQLTDKTFPEFNRWFKMAINREWWDVSALTIKPHKWIGDEIERQLRIGVDDWGVFGTPWSKENPDAYAGRHNMYGLAVLFDEASGIPPGIWDVADGFFTEPTAHRAFIAFSQGRRSVGRLYDIFHKDKVGKRWRKRQIDSRTIEGVDMKVLQGIIDAHGKDSDTAKIEVYGQFPSSSPEQFIDTGVVLEAQNRTVPYDPWAPLVLGVDPAPVGTMVARFRCGSDARSIPRFQFNNMTHSQRVAAIANLIAKYRPDHVCIDTGHGWPLIQSLRDMGHKINAVEFGKDTLKDKDYAFNRTALWGRIKDWLDSAEEGGGDGCIDDSDVLKADLIAPEWKWFGREDGRKILKSKEQMEEEGVPSPHDADALACTFWKRWPRLDRATSVQGRRNVAMAQDVDDNPYGF